MPITSHERQTILETLAASERHLIRLLDSLTPAQWSFHESPERWSIVQIVEHLVIFEGFITQAVHRALDEPSRPEKTAHVTPKDPLVCALADPRIGAPLTAREATRPTSQTSATPERLLADLCQARARTFAFAATTPAALRSHFFAHIVHGDLDGYQWLLLLGHHTTRHCIQIEQIKSHPHYPAS